MINCCIGLASIAFVAATRNGFLSGMTYVLIGPSLALHGMLDDDLTRSAHTSCPVRAQPPSAPPAQRP